MLNPSDLPRHERRALARRLGATARKLGKVTNRTATADPANPDFGGAVPADPAGFEEVLNDGNRVATMIKNGVFGQFVTAYADSKSSTMSAIRTQVVEQTEAAMTAWLKEHGETDMIRRINLTPEAYLTPEQRNRVKREGRTVSNPQAVAAPLNGLFDNLTDFMQAVWWNANPNAETAAKLQKIRDYSEKVPSEGGFLVPEEFRSEILRMQLEASIVRPRARVIPMASPRLNFPAIDETSHVSSVFGGVVVYRTEEGAELTESQAAFGQIKLDVTKQTALAHVPNELVRDWGGFDAFINGTLPEACGYYEDLDMLSGNGVGAPLGALSPQNEALLVIAAESGQTSSTIVWENVLRMYSRMLPASIGRAVWLASPDCFVELATMALSVGTGGSAVWLVDGRGEPVLTLLGRPVIMTEKAPGKLGAQGDLSFVDFGMYLIGDYQAVTVDSSKHVKFTSDKTTYRMIARNDGRPWLLSALTPHNNSPSLSGFVQLAARP